MTGDLSMSNVLKEVLAANEKYAANFGDKGKLAMPPSRRFAILTCMDARLHPSKYAGLSEGDAHVIRNAGGRATSREALWTMLRASAATRWCRKASRSTATSTT